MRKMTVDQTRKRSVLSEVDASLAESEIKEEDSAGSITGSDGERDSKVISSVSMPSASGYSLDFVQPVVLEAKSNEQI